MIPHRGKDRGTLRQVETGFLEVTLKELLRINSE
jgi:hypothetical protein